MTIVRLLNRHHNDVDIDNYILSSKKSLYNIGWPKIGTIVLYALTLPDSLPDSPDSESEIILKIG